MPDSWQLILVGDGSGSALDRPSGWAVAAIEADRSLQLFWGAMNTGTVQVSELMPYLQALAYYGGRKEPPRDGIWEVHLVTDSDYLFKLGRGDYSQGPTVRLWGTVLASLRAQGFSLHWHWRRRETLQLNRWADDRSRKARLKLQELS